MDDERDTPMDEQHSDDTPHLDLETLRTRVDGIRLLAGMTRDQLAQRINVSPDTYRGYFTGSRRMPWHVAEASADACDAPRAVLLKGWDGLREAIHEEAAELATVIDRVVEAGVRARLRQQR